MKRTSLPEMRDLIIYGAGGFGRETALLIRQVNSHRPIWNLIGFCDDKPEKGGFVDGLKVLGGIHDLNMHPSEVAVAIAVANPQTRRNIKGRIVNPRVTFPILVHPSAMLGDQDKNRIGEGSIITAGTILTTNIQVGSFVIINLSCTIGHDVSIADFCSIMPGCSISGFVTIGEAVQLGSGAIILPGLGIGSNSRVGAGAVVTRNVMADTTVVGVPAKVM